MENGKIVAEFKRENEVLKRKYERGKLVKISVKKLNYISQGKANPIPIKLAQQEKSILHTYHIKFA